MSFFFERNINTNSFNILLMRNAMSTVFLQYFHNKSYVVNRYSVLLVEITRSHEKLGGRQRPARQMEEFRDVLDECGFWDLGFMGGKFTWCNGHPDGFTIWERLDRAVATMEWLDKFPTTKVIHLECGLSDHKPILICLNGIPKL